MALADLLSLGAPVLPAADAPHGLQFNLPTQAPQPQMHQPSGIGRFLGMIGDALLVSHGIQPAYQQRMEQQRQQQALQGFLTNPDQAIAQLMQVPGQAENAIGLYKAVHPASETPVGVKEYEYEQKLTPDQRTAYEHMLSLTHPGIATPYSLPEGAHVETTSNLPHVTDQASYDAVPAGGNYTTDGVHIRQKPGGQTATPSGGFLDAVTSRSESGGNDLTPSGAPVTSSKGAKYAMQVLPSTAADPGFGVAPAQSDSPAEYDRVGRQYRSALLGKYGGNLARMWAAYNMGPGALDNALSKYGDDWLSHVPSSVRSYVATNLKSAGAL